VTQPLLICLMGAECTGKTTLARELAGHFGGLWVPEYLRDFCALQGRSPKPDEQPDILQVQLERQAHATATARRQGLRHVFCDTSALQTAIYSDFYFSDASLYPLAHAQHANYKLTLLLTPDLPWQADGVQRDSASVQDRVHTLIARELGNRYAWVGIAGSGLTRLAAAIKAVNGLGQSGPDGSVRQV